MPKRTCYLIVHQDLLADGSFVTSSAGLYSESAQSLTSLGHLNSEVLHCESDTFEGAMREVMRVVNYMAGLKVPTWVALRKLLSHYEQWGVTPEMETD